MRKRLPFWVPLGSLLGHFLDTLSAKGVQNVAPEEYREAAPKHMLKYAKNLTFRSPWKCVWTAQACVDRTWPLLKQKCSKVLKMAPFGDFVGTLWYHRAEKSAYQGVFRVMKT